MIYLDHAATSPMSAAVLDAMRPWMGVPANPSSAHRLGQAAAAAVERARDDVAALVGADPRGVVFTSGATEANHLHLRGLGALVGDGAVAVSAIEHPSVHAAVARCGLRRLALDVDADGRITAGALPDDLRVLVWMAANHETGVVQDLDAARALAARTGARLHVDASQAAGKIPVDAQGIDGLVLSAHKLGGPVGVGALVLPTSAPFPALFAGAQERGRRAGTVNVAGVVGFAAACAVARVERAARATRIAAARDRLEAALVAAGARVVGARSPRLPGTSCVVFPGLRGETVVQALDLAGFCVSSGAACASGSSEPSPVLRAMGDPEPAGAVRFSLGPGTTAAEVDAVVAALPEVARRLREAAAWED